MTFDQDPVARLHERARRYFSPRHVPDIVDLLEGRAFEIVDGKRVELGPLHLRDKDSDYRGPFSLDRAPDMAEILRSCVSPDIESTVIVGPAQSYKTTILIGVAAYTVKIDPGGVAWVFGTAPVAKAFSQKRLQETVDATSWLAALKPSDPDDWKDMELSFQPCTVRFAGANSPGNLATFPYRRVIGDEVDKYPTKLRKEAGTLELLTLRTEQVARFNHIFASTPTIATGPIWQAALKGDCRRYHVPCRKCSTLFVQRLDLLVFEHERTASGGVDWDRLRRTAHMKCPHCGEEHFEQHRRDMLHNGVWIPDPVEVADAARAEHDIVADPRRRSYFRSCFNVLHPNRTFARIAEKHIKAGKNPTKRQNFTNGELGEVYEEAAERIESQPIADRAESYLAEDAPVLPGQPIPERVAEPVLPMGNGVLVLVAGVDVQGDRLECEIVAYGEGEETWGVQYAIIPGKPQDRDTWDRLDELLLRPWRHPLGYTLTPAAVAIDTGSATEEVYKYVQRCARSGRKVIAVKGSSGGYGEPLLFRPRKSGVKAVPLWMIGTTTAKEYVYTRLRITEPGPGCMHFPKNPRRGYDLAYFRGLTAERRLKKRVGNLTVVKFVNPSGRRNEPLDVRGYAHGAFTFLNPNFDELAKKVEALQHPPQPPPDPLPVVNPEPVTPPTEGATFDPESGKVEPAAPAEPQPPGPPPQAAPNTYRVTPPPPVRRVIRGPRRNFATNW